MIQHVVKIAINNIYAVNRHLGVVRLRDPGCCSTSITTLISLIILHKFYKPGSCTKLPLVKICGGLVQICPLIVAPQVQRWHARSRLRHHFKHVSKTPLYELHIHGGKDMAGKELTLYILHFALVSIVPDG